MTPQSGLAALRRVNRLAEIWDDVGGPLVFLPAMKVVHGGKVATVDCLLAPRAHSGYTTRLFHSQPFPDRGQNWTVHQIMGRAWHTMSYQNVPASLPWTEILANHLAVLR